MFNTFFNTHTHTQSLNKSWETYQVKESKKISVKLLAEPYGSKAETTIATHDKNKCTIYTTIPGQSLKQQIKNAVRTGNKQDLISRFATSHVH